MSIQDNIKTYRKLNKMTQDDLANKMGVSKNTIWNYENDKNKKFDHGLLTKLANALDINVSDLLGQEEMGRDGYFDIKLIRERTYDIFEEVYNHSKAKDEMNLSTAEFSKMDKYFLDQLLNLFIKTTFVSIESVKQRIAYNDNAIRSELPSILLDITASDGSTITKAIPLPNKLNDPDYVLSKIKYYQYLLKNIHEGLDNYAILEQLFDNAKNISEKNNIKHDNGVRDANQEDFDKF